MARVAHPLLAGQAGGADGRQPGRLPGDDPALDHGDVVVAERRELGGHRRGAVVGAAVQEQALRGVGGDLVEALDQLALGHVDGRRRCGTRPTRSARGRRSASRRWRSPRARPPNRASRSPSAVNLLIPIRNHRYYFRKCSNGGPGEGHDADARTSSLRCGMLGRRAPPPHPTRRADVRGRQLRRRAGGEHRLDRGAVALGRPSEQPLGEQPQAQVRPQRAASRATPPRPVGAADGGAPVERAGRAPALARSRRRASTSPGRGGRSGRAAGSNRERTPAAAGAQAEVDVLAEHVQRRVERPEAGAARRSARRRRSRSAS